MNWIKMSDKLPKDNERVLVTFEWEDGERTVEHMIWFENLSGRDNYGFGNWTNRAIAWMPYPKPYMGDKNGNG